MTNASTNAGANAGLSILKVRRSKPKPGSDHVEYKYVLPDGSKQQKDRTQHTRDNLEMNLADAAARLHQFSTGGDPAANEYDLGQLGVALSERYLDEAMLKALFDDDGPLLIDTNDPTFPWELVYYKGKWLGTFRPLGRGNLRPSPHPGLETWGETPHALLLGNPTCDEESIAPKEIAWLKRELQAHKPQYDVDDRVGPNAGRNVAANLLDGPVEFLHFAGHVSFDVARPGDITLLFPNGNKITPEDIQRLAGPYAYVFINGCASARAIQESQPGMYQISTGSLRITGLATSFLGNGASVFIGALWPVGDHAAYNFAQMFYSLALGAGEVSCGEALRLARAEWRKQWPKDPTWGAYVLYGDPRHTLVTVRDPAHARLVDPRLRPARERIHQPSGPSPDSSRMRHGADQAEAFFQQYGNPDEELDVRLAPDGAAALTHAIRWVTNARWHLMARFDLLLGLAHDPNGVVARGLRAYGADEAIIERMNLKLFGKGRGAVDLPYASGGVATALRRAARLADEDGREEVTLDDLANGLLDLPIATGSLLSALKALGCKPQDLLAAGRGHAVTHLDAPIGGLASEAYTPHELAGRYSAKDDKTPRNLLRDLREEVTLLARADELPPFIGREQELRAMVRILAREYSPQGAPSVTPHVVVRGPAGAGSTALANALMARMTLSPDAGELASLRNWDIFALRVTRESERINEWLRNEVQNRQKSTILLIEDLPELLAYDGLSETLMIAARHPNLRLVAVARRQEYATIRDDFPGLARLFNSIDVEPPRPEVALEMTRAHLARLQKDGAQIAPDALTEAVRLTAHATTRALPGAPISVLKDACAEALRLTFADEPGATGLRADDDTGAIIAESGEQIGQIDQNDQAGTLHQQTLPESAPVVTVELVRAVAKRLRLI